MSSQNIANRDTADRVTCSIGASNVPVLSASAREPKVDTLTLIRTLIEVDIIAMLLYCKQ